MSFQIRMQIEIAHSLFKWLLGSETHFLNSSKYELFRLLAYITETQVSNVHMGVVLLNSVGLLSCIKLLMAVCARRRDVGVSKHTLFFVVNFQEFCELITKILLAFTICC